MDARTELGDFLRSRRARLKPEDVGLPDYGRRRVPGLRREELAQLAGVSADYYVRVEQGRNVHPSEGVLDSIARALRLDAAETAHLHTLAHPRRPRRRPAARQRVRPQVQRLLDTMERVPAVVLGRRLDVLAWNAIGTAALHDFGALEPRERNMLRHVFLHPDARDYYVDYEEVAAETVGYLRHNTALDVEDPATAELIGEVSLRSPLFADLWARHDVREKTFGVKRMNHPLVGLLELHWETLHLTDPDQCLVTYTALPGSDSERALALLAMTRTQADAVSPARSPR